MSVSDWFVRLVTFFGRILSVKSVCVFHFLWKMNATYTNEKCLSAIPLDCRGKKNGSGTRETNDDVIYCACCAMKT
jgi:hypothetical protein